MLVSIILAVTFIVWGPTGDFIAGRAFTVRCISDRVLRRLIYAFVFI